MGLKVFKSIGLTIKSWGEFRLYFSEISSNLLHGLNEVNPKVAIHLIQIYVMPRLLYGLEITTLRHNEIQKLEIYFKKLLAVAIRVWTSSFRLLPVEILSIPRWVALFVADISLLFRYHLCSFVQLNVSIDDFCSLMRYLQIKLPI
jgi:hypothetical protein